MSPVDLGAGLPAESVTAGGAAHVRCSTTERSAAGNAGQLGYADTTDVGDDEAPGRWVPIAPVPEVTGLPVTAGRRRGLGDGGRHHPPARHGDQH